MPHVGAQQPGGQLQQGGLARAVRADEPDDAALGDGQRAVAQRPGPPVLLAEPAGLDDSAHQRPPRRSSCGTRCGRSPRCRRGPGPPRAPSAASRSSRRGTGPARPGRSRRRADDERAQPRPGAHQALALQVPVGLEHRVRVDRQLGDHLLRGRQLVARLEHPELQGLAGPAARAAGRWRRPTSRRAGTRSWSLIPLSA